DSRCGRPTTAIDWSSTERRKGCFLRFSLSPYLRGEGRGEGRRHTPTPERAAAPHHNPLPILKKNGEREWGLNPASDRGRRTGDRARGRPAPSWGQLRPCRYPRAPPATPSVSGCRGSPNRGSAPR